MKKIALATALLCAASNVLAAPFSCNTQVLSVLVYSEGSVNVKHAGRGDYTMVCNLNSNYGSVTPTVCAMWTAMLQSAEKDNRALDFYYNGSGSQTSCATLATYFSALVPVYIGPI